MARNGSGSYSRAVASYVGGTTIDQVAVNQEMDDIATALTGSIAKNGETVPSANLPMGTYRHTGVGNGVARTDYAALGQTQDGKVNWVDGGGTADAITATYSPVITALVDGQLCCVRATAANATTTPTFSPNSLTARTIVKNGGVALVAGDIVGDGHELVLRYDLANTRWELLNPAIDADLLAIGALAKTDGNFIVGDGSAWVAESGATVRASMGLGTAAVVATGTASGNVPLVGTKSATETLAGLVELATVAECETGTATTVVTTPAGVAAAIAALTPAPVVLTSGTAVASTSGTAIDFTSIPAGTKRITVMVSALSTNGSTAPMIQIGDAGGVETTGYAGSISAPGASSLFSAGFALHTASFAATYVLEGIVILSLQDAATNTWVASGGLGRTDSAAAFSFGGTKSLSAALDRVRLTTTNGTDAFDAGKINILYE